MRLLNLVFRLLGWLVTAALALGLLSVMVFFMAPRLLGWELQVVLSGSMEPALPVGSVTFVESTAPDQVEVGDMLAYRLPGDPGRQITHRVVEVAREGSSLSFRTKGDANDKSDNYIVPADNVVGTVRWDVPYLGYLVERLRTPQGFLVLVGMPGLLIIAGEVWNIIRVLKGDKPKELGARSVRGP